MTELSSEQIKGRIRSISKKNHADPRILMRIYMMERFLERIAHSNYRESFVFKGGILITSMVGHSLRTTRDIDTSVLRMNGTKEHLKQVLSEIASIRLEDGVQFTIRKIEEIMKDKEYPRHSFFARL